MKDLPSSLLKQYFSDFTTDCALVGHVYTAGNAARASTELSLHDASAL